MATEFHLTETAVPMATPSFLQWVPDATGALHLVLEPQMQCPACGDFCGYLYRDEDTPNGACLSCKIDADVIDRREAEEDERAWAESCCTCGID